MTSEQAAFIHHGPGANGKSTFFKTIMGALGSYAMTAGPALVDRKSDNREQAYETARLAGARLVTISETESNSDLAMAVIKRLTGGEEVSARHSHGRPFSFQPVCKLHLATNHLPQIRDSSHGAWRRIVPIPWSETIAAHERDERLMTKLTAELPGVLAWIVEGARLYLKEGLKKTKSSIALMNALRADSDDVGQWLEEQIVAVPGAATSSSALYERYCRWAKQNGSIPQPIRQWAARLTSQGHVKAKNSRGNMVWKGLESNLPAHDASDAGNAGAQEWGRPPFQTTHGGSRII